MARNKELFLKDARVNLEAAIKMLTQDDNVVPEIQTLNNAGNQAMEAFKNINILIGRLEGERDFPPQPPAKGQQGEIDKARLKKTVKEDSKLKQAIAVCEELITGANEEGASACVNALKQLISKPEFQFTGHPTLPPLVKATDVAIKEVLARLPNRETRQKRIQELMAKTAMPDSRSLHDAFNQFDMELVMAIEGDSWSNNKPVSVFDLDRVTHAPLTLKDYLGKLRARLNKSYMPSATGEVEFNSKPEYLDWEPYQQNHPMLEDFPTFPEPKNFWQISGVVSLNKVLFAYVTDGRIYALTNLATCETLLSTAYKPTKWYRWDDYEQGLVSFDLFKLDEHIQIYL